MNIINKLIHESQKSMSSIVESIFKFNGRIYYGCDNQGNRHDKNLLIDKKRGQVAIIFNSDGTIKEAKIFKNKFLANEYLIAVTPSNGIIA